MLLLLHRRPAGKYPGDCMRALARGDSWGIEWMRCGAASLGANLASAAGVSIYKAAAAAAGHYAFGFS